MIGRLVLLAAALGAVGAGRLAATPAEVVEVPAGSPVTSAVEAAEAGATVRLLPGRHAPFEVARTVTVEAAPGAVASGPVVVVADGARLLGLAVEGGESGIIVREAEGVVLEGVTVRGADLHGIEVVDGAAAVRGCVIQGLRSPYAQGLEVRNANGKPRTTVEGCAVSSGQEGLVSHVSAVEFRDNRVRGTSLRAIAVTEMSRGLVEGNRVEDARGVGLYCGDMSHCEFRHNVVRGVAPDPSGARSLAGYGAVAWYYASMRLEGNTFEVAADEPVRLSMGGALTDRFPLPHWPPGWRGAVPAVWVSAAAVLGLLAVRWGVGRQLSRRPAGRARPVAAGALNVLAAGLLVQTFHMLEHGVQVFQVFVAQAETRSGLAGAAVDGEWLHFGYNAAVMAFLVWAWRLVRPGGPLAARVGTSGASFLAASALIQAYHVAEHTAKILQHLGSGLDPAPGLLGGVAGLVWFHYGINLAVYVGMAVPLARLAAGALAARPSALPLRPERGRVL